MFNHVTIQSLMLWSKKWLLGNFLKKLSRTLVKVVWPSLWQLNHKLIR